MDTSSTAMPVGGQDRFRLLFEHAPLCIQEIDAQGRLIAMNTVGKALMWDDGEEGIGTRPFLDLVSPADREHVASALGAALAGRAVQCELRAAGTTPRHFASCFIPCATSGGLIGIAADISPQKAIEADLRRLVRTYAVLTDCNRALARSVKERDLLRSLCQHLVEQGGYQLAWIAYTNDHNGGGVRPMAQAGRASGDVSPLIFAQASDDEGPSVCRMAIEREEALVFRDLEGLPLRPWVDLALAAGYRSMVVLPLKLGDRAFGSLSLFAATGDAFDAAEMSLLGQLAADLAFGVATIRARARRVRRLRERVEREERGRIAAVLHDVVGQSLLAVTLGLKRMRAMMTALARTEVHELLDRIIEQTATTMQEMRAAGRELRPLFLEHMSLGEAIHYHCEEIVGHAGVEIRPQVDTDLAVSDRIKEQGFLAFREALGNALKHAQANRIDVTLRVVRPDLLRIIVADDGVGFDRQLPNCPSGLGLCMIRERAESLGGHAQIKTAEGKGTRICITIPFAPEAPDDAVGLDRDSQGMR